MVAAHQQTQTHHNVMHFPPQPARAHGPRYVDFKPSPPAAPAGRQTPWRGLGAWL
jgi:hypothetical protein